jgi:uncharacterized protein (TIGR02271 family)
MQTEMQQIQPGWAVYGSDDQKIGDVNQVGPNYVLVTKGLIFLKDLYIPFDEISNVDPDRQSAFLDVAKDEVESMGWDQIPGDGESRTSGYAGGPEAGVSSRDAGTRYADSSAGESDTFRVPVHEEELQAEKRASQTGEVRVDKNVREEQRDLDVPVTRDEVQVRRVNVNRDVTGDEQAFDDGGTIRVPVTEEQVEVTKRPRVVEEIEVSKRPVTETQRVSDTVRREEVDVRQEGDTGVRDEELAGSGAGASYAAGDSEWRADAARDTVDPADRRSDLPTDR